MAKSPPYKVYVHNEYIASTKNIQNAALLLSAYTDPAWGKEISRGAISPSPVRVDQLKYPPNTIRHGHRRVIWTDGADGWATDSYDMVAEIAGRRVHR
jgi:hypothetical protein